MRPIHINDIILVTWEQEGEERPDQDLPYFATVTCS
jgi:hypothetical protein